MMQRREVDRCVQETRWKGSKINLRKLMAECPEKNCVFVLGSLTEKYVGVMQDMYEDC